MTLRRLHRLLAVMLGLFLLVHLGNHLAGLWGQDAHGWVQSMLRRAYRNPATEPLLLAAFAMQIMLGLRLLTLQRRLTVQGLAGAYLALFLAIHVGAVMVARWQGTDTDLAFAAAGLHAPPPWPQVFGAYYGLAVLAIFTHLSRPLGRLGPGFGTATLVAGAVISATIVLLLSGAVVPLVIPPALIDAFP